MDFASIPPMIKISLDKMVPIKSTWEVTSLLWWVKIFKRLKWVERDKKQVPKINHRDEYISL